MDTLMGYLESVRATMKDLQIKEGAILVTGATGLIGSCLIDSLLSAIDFCTANFKIYALSRSEKRIRERFGERVMPIAQNIRSPLNLSIDYDYIIHAASNADPKMYATEPVETILTNVIGTKNVLDYCKEHITTKVLLASTFEVYGKIENVEIYSENMSGEVDFQFLRNGYTESKRCAEILLKSYVEEFEVDAVIARLASIYGSTMLSNDSKAHAQFIRNAIRGEDIILKSEGVRRRTYCYVLDAVSAIMTVLLKGKAGEAYNVANENAIATIAEVAEICAKIAGTKVVYDLPDEIEAKGFSKPQNCILDNAKLKKLGWSGRFSLEEGLEETIEELKHQDGIGIVK